VITPRQSLYYVAFYLLTTGVALLIAPEWVMRTLLFSNGSYGDVMPRAVAVFMTALGYLVTQLIRADVPSLYPATVRVRLIFLAGFIGLYFYSKDPMFLVITAVVLVGVLLTSTSLLRKKPT
jgi:hypothetical protein